MPDLRAAHRPQGPRVHGVPPSLAQSPHPSSGTTRRPAFMVCPSGACCLLLCAAQGEPPDRGVSPSLCHTEAPPARVSLRRPSPVHPSRLSMCSCACERVCTCVHHMQCERVCTLCIPVSVSVCVYIVCRCGHVSRCLT